MAVLLHKDYVISLSRPYVRPLLWHLFDQEEYRSRHANAQEHHVWNFRGKKFLRIPHSNKGASTVYGDCFDCSTRHGELHLLGCILEICPQCGGYVAICGCHICNLSPEFECRKHRRTPNRMIFYIKDVLLRSYWSIRDNQKRIPAKVVEDAWEV